MDERSVDYRHSSFSPMLCYYARIFKLCQWFIQSLYQCYGFPIIIIFQASINSVFQNFRIINRAESHYKHALMQLSRFSLDIQIISHRVSFSAA